MPSSDKTIAASLFQTSRRAALTAIAILLAGTASAGCRGEAPAETPAYFTEATRQLPLQELTENPQLRMFGTNIYILEPTAESPPELAAGFSIQSSLQRLKPRAEELVREIAAAAPTNIFIGNAVSGDPADTTKAWTWCGPTDEVMGVLGYGFSNAPPPGEKSCLITTYVDRLFQQDNFEFALGHELFHTLQQAEFSWECEGLHWWSEGSADWFGHELVHGVTFRDGHIAEFIENEASKPITDFSYEAQVFSFWASRHIDRRWVMELGMGGDEWLTSPDRAAQVMGPGHWLDWASDSMDGSIKYPDGRNLPPVELADVLIPVPECSDGQPVIHAGPPLSAQFLKLRIEDSANTDFIDIDAGTAWLRIFGAGPEPLDLEGGSVQLRLEGATELQIAAIVPGGEDMTLSFTPGNDQNTEAAQADARFRQTCGCASKPAPAARQDSCLQGNWRVTKGIVAWLQEVSALASRYGASASAAGTMDDDVVYTFDGNHYTVRSAGGTLNLDGMWAMKSGAVDMNHPPNTGSGLFCSTSDGVLMMSAAQGDIVSGGGTVAVSDPLVVIGIGQHGMETEPSAFDYSCGEDTLRLTYQMEGSAGLPPGMPPLVIELRRVH